MESITMSTILTDIGTFFTQALTWVGNVCETIVSEPLLLIFVAMGVAGVAIGYVSRLIRVS